MIDPALIAFFVEEVLPRAGSTDVERTCSKCHQPITQDTQGSWVDCTDGDCCPEDNGVHEPF